MDQKIFTPTFLPAEAFPLSDPRKGAIKLGQLLRFTACIRGNNPGYVLPSLDLVVWKLGGPDGQFDPRDTGMQLQPDGAWGEDRREDWTQTAGDRTTPTETLRKVIAAILSR